MKCKNKARNQAAYVRRWTNLEEKNGLNRAVMIDGFGTTDFIPICHYFPHLARLKILRHWERFLPKIGLSHPSVE